MRFDILNRLGVNHVCDRRPGTADRRPEQIKSVNMAESEKEGIYCAAKSNLFTSLNLLF